MVKIVFFIGTSCTWKNPPGDDAHLGSLPPIIALPFFYGHFPPSLHSFSLSLSFISSKVTFTVIVEVRHQLHTQQINADIYEVVLRFFLKQEYV